MAELLLENHKYGDILFAAGATESMFMMDNDKRMGKNSYNLIRADKRIGYHHALARLTPGKKMTSRTITTRPPDSLAHILKTGAYRLPISLGLPALQSYFSSPIP